MKLLMGSSPHANSTLHALANEVADGDMQLLVNTINEFLVSVSNSLPKLGAHHPLFQSNQLPVPTTFTITVQQV